MRGALSNVHILSVLSERVVECGYQKTGREIRTHEVSLGHQHGILDWGFLLAGWTSGRFTPGYVIAAVGGT